MVKSLKRKTREDFEKKKEKRAHLSASRGWKKKRK
jgi:hypothetical protein